MKLCPVLGNISKEVAGKMKTKKYSTKFGKQEIPAKKEDVCNLTFFTNGNHKMLEPFRLGKASIRIPKFKQQLKHCDHTHH